jgi:hypothetical protein
LIDDFIEGDERSFINIKCYIGLKESEKIYFIILVNKIKMESSESEVETLKLENSVLKKEIETLREYLKQLLDAIQEM